MRSPRRWAALAGWLAATLTSIVLASVAMLPVLRTATGGDGGLISADQLRRSGAGSPIPLPPVPSPSVPTRPRATTPPATSPSDASEKPDPPAKSASPTPSRSPSPSASPADTPEVETRVVDGWTVTTDGGGVDTYVRSFQVDGGQAVIRIRDGRVTLVTATPSNGFEVATVQNSPDNLAVYFNEPNHSFIVHAVWNVDRPFAQVDEIGG